MIGRLQDHLPLIVAALAAAQWLVVAGASAFSRAPLPKKATMRPQEKRLLVSTVVFFAGWFLAFDGMAFFGVRRGTKTLAASAAVSRQSGSCASISSGMTGAEVQSLLGRPDEVRNDEEVRGPGSVEWLYRGSRCVVHLLDDKVEFVD